MDAGPIEFAKERAVSLGQRLMLLQGKKHITASFVPSSETNFISYFSKNLNAELASALDRRYVYLPPEKSDQADIVILTAHGSDLSTRVWNLRKHIKEDAVIAIWLWDNHLTQLNNYRTILAADFVLPSHAYAAGYLFNPFSVIGAHIPACSAQWTRKEIRNILELNPIAARKHKALVNYVDYPFSWRSKLLHELKDGVDEAEVILMPPDDRSRYFGMTSEQRFFEWLQYKATVILPVDKDLSTRLFDALLGGQIPIVPETIADIDHVIPAHLQRDLGLVRVRDVTVPALKKSISEALETFDRMGEAGVNQRQEYVLNHHMLPNRINSILDSILGMAKMTIVAGIDRFGFGLYLAPTKASSE